MIDQIRTLRAADLSITEINYVLNRDHGVTVSSGLISDIYNGYRHADKGDFKESDIEYIQSLVDGEPIAKDIPNLEKFGIALMFETTKVEDIISHYSASTSIVLDENKILEVVEEIRELIESGRKLDENEQWFVDQITNK